MKHVSTAKLPANYASSLGPSVLLGQDSFSISTILSTFSETISYAVYSFQSPPASASATLLDERLGSDQALKDQAPILSPTGERYKRSRLSFPKSFASIPALPAGQQLGAFETLDRHNQTSPAQHSDKRSSFDSDPNESEHMRQEDACEDLSRKRIKACNFQARV